MAEGTTTISPATPIVTVPNTDIGRLQAQFSGLTVLEVLDTGIKINAARAQPPDEGHPLNGFTMSLDYLQTIQDELGGMDNPVYREMVQLFTRYRDKELDVISLLKKFACQFRAYPNIIQGMGPFLPKGWSMEIDSHGGERVGVLTTEDEKIRFSVEDAPLLR